MNARQRRKQRRERQRRKDRVWLAFYQWKTDRESGDDTVTPEPRYDDVFFKGVAWLDTL